MSSVADENIGPGVLLKEAVSQDGPLVSSSIALKQSNKVNIMSPPQSPSKKQSKGDTAASVDATVIKENLDYISPTDASNTDDDDIISFKPLDTFTAAVDDDIDPFKPRTQILNSPVGNSKEIEKMVSTACSDAQKSEQHSDLEKDSFEGGILQEPQITLAELGAVNMETVSEVDDGSNPDSFKPSCQLSGSSDMNLKDAGTANDCSCKQEAYSDKSKAADELEESIDKQKGEGADKVSSSNQNPIVADGMTEGEPLDPPKSKECTPQNPETTETEGLYLTENQISDQREETQNAEQSETASEKLSEQSNTSICSLKGVTGSSTSADISEEMYSFQPKMQLEHSGQKEEDTSGAIDPFKSRSQLANLPGKEKDIGEDFDPFKPQTQLVNSSASAEVMKEVCDPFKPKTQLANSPIKLETITNESDPLKVEGHPENSPEKMGSKEDYDPFKPRAQLANSPAKAETVVDNDLLKPKEKVMNCSEKPENVDEADPFRPKTQLANSPKVENCEGIEPFKPTTPMANSTGTTEIFDESDPFKLKVQLANSPRPMEDMEEADPFKSETLLAKSPTEIHYNEEIDPFKPKSQLSNSPGRAENVTEAELYKPQQELGNPLAKENACEEMDSLKPNTPLVEKMIKQDHDSDASLCNSKTLSSVETGESKTESIGHSSENQSKIEPEKKLETAASVLEGLDALEGRGQSDKANNQVLLVSSDDLGFDENMFISGTQVFNDPKALDLLEQFGGAGEVQETDLRKCSLYVKFDPLVKPTLPKTPEKMPAPSQPAPRRAGGRPHEVLNASQLNASQINASMGEESICLFGTPPRVARRRSVLSQRRMNMSSVSQTITEEEHARPVDLLFSLDGDNAENKFLNDPSKQNRSATLVDVEEGAKYTEAQHQQLQQALSMQYEEQILARERKFASQLAEKTSTIEQLQEKLDIALAEKQKLSNSMGSMTSCVAEYEKTLNVLIAAKEKSAADSASQLEILKKERDQALEDVQALENSFSEFHRRYEKLKQTLDGYRKNEETLKKTITMWQEKLKVSEDNLAKVKTKAEEKIKEVVEVMGKKEADVARLEAEIKRTKLHVQSLENTLEQKSKENKELTELCDTLIVQVGGGGK